MSTGKVPIRVFNGTEGVASKLFGGPEQLEADLDSIFMMFNTLGMHADGTTHGGIGTNNLQAGSIDDVAIGDLTPNQAIADVPPAVFTGSGKLSVVLSWMAKVIVSITGKTNWWELPTIAIEALNTLLNSTITTLNNLVTTVSNLILTVNTNKSAYDTHRTTAILDHPDGSVKAQHIDPAIFQTIEMGIHRTNIVIDHPDKSVTTAKLNDVSVTTAKLADKSVTADKIADGAIANQINPLYHEVANLKMIALATSRIQGASGILFDDFKGGSKQGSTAVRDDAKTTLASNASIGDSTITVDAAYTTTTNILLPNHGISTGDLIENTTRSNAYSLITATTSNLILCTTAITGQVLGDSINKYKKISTTAALSGTTTTNITITAHGLSVGDYIRNTTRSNTIAKITAIVDANNFTVSAITSQTTGDSIELYKFYAKQIAQGFVIGQELTIQDATNLRRRNILSFPSYNQIQFSSTLDVAFSISGAGAFVGRSNIIEDTANGLMKFGTVGSTTTYDRSTPVNVVASAFDISGVGDKVTYLNNGWIVSCEAKPTSGYEWHVSKDNGATFIRLCHDDHAGYKAPYAICSFGTKVFTLTNNSNTTMSLWIFDATTQTDVALGAATIDVDTQTLIGTGCSIKADTNGNISLSLCSKNATYPNSFNARHAKLLASENYSTVRKADGTAGIDQVTLSNISGTDSINPYVVIVNGKPVVIFQTVITSSAYCIQCRYWDGSAWQWSSGGTGYVYNGTTYVQSNPKAHVMANGWILCVWDSKDATYPTYNVIKISVSKDGGATWVKLSDGTAGYDKVSTDDTWYNVRPSVVSDSNNNVYVLWSGNSSGHYRIKKRVFTTSWGAVTELTSNTTADCDYSQVVTNYTNFTEPLCIYQDNQAVAIKFRGIWTVGSLASVLVVDAHYNDSPSINPKSEIAWIQSQKDAGFTVDFAISMVDAGQPENFVSIDKGNASYYTKLFDDGTNIEEQFMGGVVSAKARVSYRITMTRTATTIDKGVSRLLGVSW